MSDSPRSDGSKNQPIGFLRAYKEFGPYLTLGFQMAAAVVILFFLGDWADQSYGTSPLFALLGVAIGTVGGLIKFFQSVMQSEKKSKVMQNSGRGRE
ncbi:MAG TPA: AtpZ/AtpI family protein [Bacteroidota bacterium]|nr:AtpZ/AtpI family protein [Bacteroidota bacterium]